MIGGVIIGQFILASPTNDGTVPPPTPPATGNIGDGPLRWTRWGRAFMYLHQQLPSSS